MGKHLRLNRNKNADADSTRIEPRTNRAKYSISNLFAKLEVRTGCRPSFFCVSIIAPRPQVVKDFFNYYCPLTELSVFSAMSMTTNSDLQPVLNLIAQSEMPELTIKVVPSRRSMP